MFGLRSKLATGVITAALLVSAGSAGSAKANLITYDFTATIDFVSAQLAGEFANGQTVTGSFTYDSSVAARVGSNSNFAVYDALTDFNFAINSTSGYAASSNSPSEVQVDNAGPPPNDDRFGVVSRVSQGLAGTTPDVGGFVFDSAGVSLFDTTDLVFSDALILPTVLDLADFDIAFFAMTFLDDPANPTAFPFVSATLTSLTRIPEPSTLALFAVALLGIGLSARRRTG